MTCETSIRDLHLIHMFSIMKFSILYRSCIGHIYWIDHIYCIGHKYCIGHVYCIYKCKYESQKCLDIRCCILHLLLRTLKIFYLWTMPNNILSPHFVHLIGRRKEKLIWYLCICIISKTSLKIHLLIENVVEMMFCSCAVIELLSFIFYW